MPATLPWPKIPKHPPKKTCSTPSRSTTCCARKRTSACAAVRRTVPVAVTARRPLGDGLVDHAPDPLLAPERDRPALAEGLLAGAGQDERRERVLAGHVRLPPLADRRCELLELEEVRFAEALGEVGDPVDRGAPRSQPDVVVAPVVADPDRRSRPDHLGRALVAVAGGARLVDHPQGTVCEPKGDDGVVDVAELGEERVGARRAERAEIGRASCRERGKITGGGTA